jgi:hypothetical protein
VARYLPCHPHPSQLSTHVKGYNPAKNDFLFERRLNEYVHSIVTNYSRGRPALVFCKCALLCASALLSLCMMMAVMVQRSCSRQ